MPQIKFYALGNGLCYAALFLREMTRLYSRSVGNFIKTAFITRRNTFVKNVKSLFANLYAYIPWLPNRKFQMRLSSRLTKAQRETRTLILLDS